MNFALGTAISDARVGARQMKPATNASCEPSSNRYCVSIGLTTLIVRRRKWRGYLTTTDMAVPAQNIYYLLCYA